MMKKFILPLSWLLTVVQLGSATAFAVILTHAKYNSYRCVATDDGKYNLLFDQAEWWKAIFSLSPMLLSALLCIGLTVATLITLYIRNHKPAVSLPIMTGLAAVGHTAFLVLYPSIHPTNLEYSCTMLLSSLFPSVPISTTMNCGNILFHTLPILFSASTVISLALFGLTLLSLIRIKKDNPPSCG